LSPDVMSEKLVQLNTVAIQCLQSGECDKAQCVLLNALDLIKARHLGIAFEQTPLPDARRRATSSGWSSSSSTPLVGGASSDAGSAMSRSLDDHRVATNDGPAVDQEQPPETTQTQQLQQQQQEQQQQLAHPAAIVYDEGFRASMEPLNFSSPAGHPTTQQAAIIYYNVGISFLCFQKLKGARQWFQLALICFEDGAAAGADPGIMARLHHNIGYCLKDEAPDRAVKSYRLALLLASRSPDLATGSFFASIFNAIGVLQYRMGQHESALVYLQDSLGRFRVLNNSSSSGGGKGIHHEQEVGTLTHNIARVRFALQEFEVALDGFERALALRRRNKETSMADLAASLCGVGSTLEKLGREDEAVEFYAELVDLDCLESSAVDLTLVCSALANIYKRQGKLNDAQHLYEKAARVGRICLGESHPVVAASLKELADCHFKSGDGAWAIENYKAALKLEQVASETTHHKTVKVLYNIALLYQKVGQYAAALDKFSMVYELQRKKYGATSQAAQKARASMADMEYRLTNYDRAIDIYRELLLLQQENGGNLSRSYLMNSLGIVSFARADYAAASHCFQSCLDTATTPEKSADSATVWYNLATAEEKRGRVERAIECFERSLAMDESTASAVTTSTNTTNNNNTTTATSYETTNHANVILDTLQRLGRLYQLSGDLHRALDCATRALALLDDDDDLGTTSHLLIVRAKLYNLSGNLHLQLGDVTRMMECYEKAVALFRRATLTAAVGPPPPQQPPYQHQYDDLIVAGFFLYGMAKLHPPTAAMA
jgi:tetratricopeptide (TPR) repeat protein